MCVRVCCDGTALFFFFAILYLVSTFSIHTYISCTHLSRNLHGRFAGLQDQWLAAPRRMYYSQHDSYTAHLAIRVPGGDDAVV